MTRYCEDCRFYQLGAGLLSLPQFARCGRPDAKAKPASVVARALDTPPYAAETRAQGDLCGPEGVWFEQSEKVPA